MGWDTKKNGSRYYYRTERRPGQLHPIKIYLGKGAEAEEAARKIEARRQKRLAVRTAILEEQMRVAAGEQKLLELGELVTLLVKAALVGAGYYNHKGEWRRRRHGKDAIRG